MREEGSKTLVIIGTVLGALMGLACLGSTAFLFLGFRMGSAPAPITVSAPAPAPAAPLPAAPPLTVLVLSDGGVIFHDAPVTDDELADELTKRFASSGDTQVVLAADERVPHARVVQLIDLAKQAGYTRIALGVSAK